MISVGSPPPSEGHLCPKGEKAVRGVRLGCCQYIYIYIYIYIRHVAEVPEIPISGKFA